LICIFQKRVVTRVNNYIYGKIDFTPFSLAIVLPEPYGSYRVEGQVEVKVKHKEENFTHYFRGKQWRVHTEWVCLQTPDTDILFYYQIISFSS